MGKNEHLITRLIFDVNSNLNESEVDFFEKFKVLFYKKINKILEKELDRINTDSILRIDRMEIDLGNFEFGKGIVFEDVNGAIQNKVQLEFINQLEHHISSASIYSQLDVLKEIVEFGISKSDYRLGKGSIELLIDELSSSDYSLFLKFVAENISNSNVRERFLHQFKAEHIFALLKVINNNFDSLYKHAESFYELQKELIEKPGKTSFLKDFNAFVLKEYASNKKSVPATELLLRYVVNKKEVSIQVKEKLVHEFSKKNKVEGSLKDLLDSELELDSLMVRGCIENEYHYILNYLIDNGSLPSSYFGLHKKDFLNLLKNVVLSYHDVLKTVLKKDTNGVLNPYFKALENELFSDVIKLVNPGFYEQRNSFLAEINQLINAGYFNLDFSFKKELDIIYLKKILTQPHLEFQQLFEEQIELLKSKIIGALSELDFKSFRINDLLVVKRLEQERESIFIQKNNPKQDKTIQNLLDYFVRGSWKDSLSITKVDGLLDNLEDVKYQYFIKTLSAQLNKSETWKRINRILSPKHIREIMMVLYPSYDTAPLNTYYSHQDRKDLLRNKQEGDLMQWFEQNDSNWLPAVKKAEKFYHANTSQFIELSRESFLNLFASFYKTAIKNGNVVNNTDELVSSFISFYADKPKKEIRVESLLEEELEFILHYYFKNNALPLDYDKISEQELNEMISLVILSYPHLLRKLFISSDKVKVVSFFSRLKSNDQIYFLNYVFPGFKEERRKLLFGLSQFENKTGIRKYTNLSQDLIHFFIQQFSKNPDLDFKKGLTTFTTLVSDKVFKFQPSKKEAFQQDFQILMGSISSLDEAKEVQPEPVFKTIDFGFESIENVLKYYFSQKEFPWWGKQKLEEIALKHDLAPTDESKIILLLLKEFKNVKKEQFYSFIHSLLRNDRIRSYLLAADETVKYFVLSNSSKEIEDSITFLEQLTKFYLKLFAVEIPFSTVFNKILDSLIPLSLSTSKINQAFVFTSFLDVFAVLVNSTLNEVLEKAASQQSLWENNTNFNFKEFTLLVEQGRKFISDNVALAELKNKLTALPLTRNELLEEVELFVQKGIISSSLFADSGDFSNFFISIDPSKSTKESAVYNAISNKLSFLYLVQQTLKSGFKVTEEIGFSIKQDEKLTNPETIINKFLLELNQLETVPNQTAKKHLLSELVNHVSQQAKNIKKITSGVRDKIYLEAFKNVIKQHKDKGIVSIGELIKSPLVFHKNPNSKVFQEFTETLNIISNDEECFIVLVNANSLEDLKEVVYGGKGDFQIEQLLNSVLEEISSLDTSTYEALELKEYLLIELSLLEELVIDKQLYQYRSSKDVLAENLNHFIKYHSMPWWSPYKSLDAFRSHFSQVYFLDEEGLQLALYSSFNSVNSIQQSSKYLTEDEEANNIIRATRENQLLLDTTINNEFSASVFNKERDSLVWFKNTLLDLTAPKLSRSLVKQIYRGVLKLYSITSESNLLIQGKLQEALINLISSNEFELLHYNKGRDDIIWLQKNLITTDLFNIAIQKRVERLKLIFSDLRIQNVMLGIAGNTVKKELLNFEFILNQDQDSHSFIHGLNEQEVLAHVGLRELQKSENKYFEDKELAKQSKVNIKQLVGFIMPHKLDQYTSRIEALIALNNDFEGNSKEYISKVLLGVTYQISLEENKDYTDFMLSLRRNEELKISPIYKELIELSSRKKINKLLQEHRNFISTIELSVLMSHKQFASAKVNSSTLSQIGKAVKEFDAKNWGIYTFGALLIAKAQEENLNLKELTTKLQKDFSGQKDFSPFKITAEYFKTLNDNLLEISDDSYAEIFAVHEEISSEEGSSESLKKLIKNVSNDLITNNDFFEEYKSAQEEVDWVQEDGAPLSDIDTNLNLYDIKEGDTIYIPNAGVIILWPFISTLFKNLGYLEKGLFKSRKHQEKAVHAIQYLVDGGERSPEFVLAFNKIMCGFMVKDPIALKVTLTKKEKAEASHFLKTVISQWKEVQNTSINGFRESFIKRGGALHYKNQKWFLKVEHKSIDILLTKLPWGLSMVKFPWNKYRIIVEWNAKN